VNKETDFEEWVRTEETIEFRVKLKKNLTDMLQKMFNDLNNCCDESCLAMHKSVAQCDYANNLDRLSSTGLYTKFHTTTTRMTISLTLNMMI
jgi:hypothetical protein